MSWLSRHYFRDFLRSSFWAAPTCTIFCAILLAKALRAFDDAYRWRAFDFTAEGAKSLLGSLSASMLTFIVVVVSSLLLVVQLVSAQLTPRIIAPTFRHPLIRLTLSVFVFTYVLSIAVLGRISDVVPQVAVAAAMISNVLSLVMFLYFVGAIGMSLRPAHVLTMTAARGREVIFEIYPAAFDASDEQSERPPLEAELGEPSLVVEHTGSSGVLLAFDTAGLIAVARQHQSVFEIVPRVGDFVAAGEPLFRVYGPPPSIDPRQILKLVMLGAERTMEQDPGLAFRVVVDIATKALSAAINDPTTAVLAIDQVHRLLRWVGTRTLHSGRLMDDNGGLRLVFPTPTWSDFVWLGTAEIRHCGSASIQVCQRLRAMLEHLSQVLPESRRPPLLEQLHLLDSAVDQKFSEPEDRQRVRTVRHGLG